MGDIWQEQGLRAERRRRLQVLALIAVVAAVAVVWAYPRSGSSNEELSTAPGFEDSERSVDTAPFEQARPNGSGATTLPDSVIDPEAVDSTVTIAPPPTTTVPPPTTTTTTTTEPYVVPEVPSGDTVCESARHIALAFVLLQDENDPVGAGAELRAAGASVAEDSQATHRRLGEFLSALAEDVAAASSGSEGFKLASTLFDPANEAVAPLAEAFREHMAAACPGLL